ncbi:MAG: carboxypeptidase regulatory-like domain-containing protein [Bryobacteraceae bacterium]
MGKAVVIGCALCFAFCSPLLAQITGEVRGLVSDPSGSAVPGAKVTLTSLETGERRSMSSDAEGRYAFPLLKIGDYSVAVEAAGFRKAVASAGVRSAEITSVNLKLEVGQVTEQVTVTDAANPLDTQSAQIQESFETKKVQEIPVTRNPNLIAATLPGVVPAPSGFNSGSFISHGNRARANNITIDNITATDISVAGTGSSNNGPLNYSSIKEVKVITNNFSAEFGRNSGSQVQYITKSGTNEIHGEAYEYFRNDYFNARDWFDRSGAPTVTRANEFGGVLGGPVIKNKTHFFVSSELFPIRGSGAARVAQVPTQSMIAQVTDPTSKRLLEFYKLPAATTDSGTFGTVQQNAPARTEFWQYSARIDHQISGRDSIYGRYGQSHNEGTSSTNTFQGTNLANFGLASTNTPYSLNVNETHIFSPTVVNEFRGGFGRTSPIFSIDTTVTPLGPRIIFSNNQIAEFGHSTSGPQGRVQNTFQYGDTINWMRRAHNVKAGADFYRYQGNSFFDAQTRGQYTFLNWDDFAAGRPNAYTQRFGSSARGHRQWIGGMFVQDDYRLRPNLTLNLGFRLEYFGPITEVNAISSNLDFSCRDSLGAAGTGAFGCFSLGKPMVRTNLYPQPRVGIAWNPGAGKTVVRAGAGLVADFNFMNPLTNQRFLAPFIVTQNLTGTGSFAGANSWASLIAGTAAIQREASSLLGRVRNDVLNYGDMNPVIDPNLENPQVFQWSFSVQRQLPENIVLKLGYVGTKANYLQRARQVNLNAALPAPAVDLADEAARAAQFLTSYNNMTGATQRFATRTDPRFNTVNYFDSSANSNFHAFEMLATRPFRGGYSIQVAYTFSKSIDDVSDGLTAIPNDSTLLQDPNNTRANRSVSGFDIPHRTVITHVWELPWGKHIASGWLRRLVAGWGTSGISQFRSGFPVSFESGPRLGVANPSAIMVGGFIRPNVAGPFGFDPQPAGSANAPQGVTNDPVAGRRISAYAASLGLSQPLLGRFGSLGRNTHRISGSTNFDWNVYKNVAITERMRVKLRCEIYNVFNHHSFQDVTRNVTSPAFAQYVTPAQGQRFLQLGAVVEF